MTIEPGEKPRRIKNISELAKLAGVSAGTVSRALAGKDLVNRQTRERIQALAREHGFRPNQMASRLRTGQTGVIGIVIPPAAQRKQHVFGPTFMSLLGFLADELTEAGFDLMLSQVAPAETEDWLDRIVDSGMLDGVLLVGQSDQFDTIERVAAHYRPLVVWGTHRPGQTHCVVGTDCTAGGKLAAQHLLDRGCRNLLFIGDQNWAEIGQRLNGARAAVAASDTNAAIEHCQVLLSTAATQGQIAETITGMGRAVDGIIAASDELAMATVRLLHEQGRRVPEDIAIVGFGDIPLARQTVPQLTTVKHHLAAGAKAMASSLLRRMAGEDVGPTIMVPALVIRESA